MRKLGWIKDLPDHRDFSPEKDTISDGLKSIGQVKSIHSMLSDVGLGKKQIKLPTKVDLTKWCSSIENQGMIGSCTANAGAALLEYFEKRAFGKYTDTSRLFLYKTTRNFLKMSGDTGATLRSTAAAMRLFGMLPEEYWPYNESDFDKEPDPFCYAYAQNYQALSFYRLDINGIDSKHLLFRIKEYLHAGLPSMFGFTVFESINQASTSGRIPFPSLKERATGGHALVAVGYSDEIEVNNGLGEKTKGAIKVRNSWGRDWGEDGYGWLPYQYILYGIAADWWSLLQNEWVDTDQFVLD